MAGRMAYLGTDLPRDQLVVPAREPGNLPQTRVPGGIPPVDSLPAVGEADQSTGMVGYDEAPEIIAEAAQQYMGVDVSTLDPAGWDQLMVDLEKGYPDDARLLEAINYVRGMETNRAMTERADTGAMPTQDAPLTFSADRPGRY